MPYVIGTLVTVVVLFFAGRTCLKYGLRTITVFEFEKGMKYSRGRFAGLLDPGKYWYIAFLTNIQKVDIRTRFLSVPGQELLSSDGITLKVSLTCGYELEDLKQAINHIADYQEALYIHLQSAIRAIIGATSIDNILKQRGTLASELMAQCADPVKGLGLKLIDVSIKDIMFPGKLKETFAQIVNARKESEALLERARAETASLRHLANAEKMLENHPHLLHLRLLQTMSQTTGNTFVIGLPADKALLAGPGGAGPGHE